MSSATQKAVTKTTTEEFTLYSDYGDISDEESELCSKEGVRNFELWFLPTFYSLVFLFGLIGNALVVLVLLKYKRLRSMTDIYLLNLAISDLLFVFALPFWSYYVADEWVFGDGLCKFISWVYLLGFYSGTFFVMLMSIDRYLAVVHVVFALRARTVNYGILASLVVWLVAISAALPQLIFSKASRYYNQTTCKPVYKGNWRIFTSLEINILGLLLPFMVMLFCYTKIVKTLLHCRDEKKKKAVKMIFAVMIVFFLFWTPYNIVSLLQCLHGIGILRGCILNKNLDYASQVTQTLAFFHCCLNPIIYFFMGQKFKKCIKLLFKNCIFSKILCRTCGLSDTFQAESSVSLYTQSTSDNKPL
ncbi:C-C chemokine receptor type 4-like isoform X2 [Hemicordylus capensis]|nr:C-C chemokine receptor type 4-like isoform X2 [Hemicordylus capensis]XP_053121745.1 C-C chemokine receptor type 4-like isoform X2 [Hemicordylus capensis]XP_053121747.1 C-C chemokine receptor type 4-like isoform X2 [Hemicordylus capensis]XP_053121748.1 C-C chemokine receptor type 4-like isoform X2 [Hemicordylus capensis]XP_053121749.1 C-C chemokine receptor type 4-like isoform X2 [Hemicordylus capensis]XP_053121750.1 C-C chemokine receptor type 4-like isoform X2 [Hemicordylus capensis]